MAEMEDRVSENRPLPPAHGPVPERERPRSEPQPGPHSPPPPTEDGTRPANKEKGG